MRRVLFVYHSSEIGGGSFCLLNLLKAIDRVAFEPMVILPNEGPLSKEIEKLGILIDYFPLLTLYPYNRPLWKFGVIRQILKVLHSRQFFMGIIREKHPDIVYFNTMMLFPYLKITKALGCKTVLHVREHWPLEDHKIQLGWARKAVYLYLDKLIAINRYSSSIFPEKEATIVYDWIDMESRRGGLTREDLVGNESNTSRIYLFTGGAQPVKGSIEVIKTFIKHIKGQDRRLLVLGLTPNLTWDGIRGQIKHILSIIGIKTYKEKVIFLCQTDTRIICAPADYYLTDLMEQVDAYISFFTIPHANLTLAESVIVGLPSLAAETSESLEYSCGSPLVHLYELGNLTEFASEWEKMDESSVLINGNSEDTSKKVQEMFDPHRNSVIFNNALIQLF